jgi:ABC-type phosphate transport system substrate-binding protein
MTLAKIAAFGSPLLALAAAVGCAQVLDATGYHTGGSIPDGGAVPDADATTGDGSSCNDAPETKLDLLNACTGAQCTTVPASQLLDGGRRALPPADMTDAGGDLDAGSDAAPMEGGMPDAGMTACASFPNVVYATGSTALVPFIAKVAQVLEQTGKATVVFQSAGSCTGVNAMLDPASTKMTGTAFSFDANATDPTMAQKPCALADSGVEADVAISDVFATTCVSLPQGLPDTLEDTFGPTQAMTFVVPTKSLQASITADAAYNVFGFGATSGVDPWTDPSLMFRRSASSGTQSMIAKVIGVPADQWSGKADKGSSDVLNDIINAGLMGDAVANKAIGILSADIAEDNRDRVRVLAFQDVGQSCAYTPDSSPTAHDKINVRDGHYSVWGPSHVFTRLSHGTPINPNAQQLAGALGGTVPLQGVDLIQLYAQKHLVPQCAMRVSRTSDGGDFKAFKPMQSCGCYFEASAVGSTSCKKCSTSSECPASAPNCNQFGSPPQGYCEP